MKLGLITFLIFNSFILFCQLENKVNFPLIKEITYHGDNVFRTCQLDSCLIKYKKKNYYFFYLRDIKNNFDNATNIKTDKDSNIYISINFEFIDTIIIDNNFYVVVNNYPGKGFYYEYIKDQNSDFIDVILVMQPLFKINISGEFLYYPLLEYESLFVGKRKKRMFRDKFIENLIGARSVQTLPHSI